MTIFRPLIYVPIFRPILKQQSIFAFVFSCVSCEFWVYNKNSFISILQICLIVITMTQTVKIEWAIKWYLATSRYRTSSSTREWKSVWSICYESNNAAFTKIPSNLHGIVTREQDRQHPTSQTVTEIAGIPAGTSSRFNNDIQCDLHIEGLDGYGIMYNWTYPASRPIVLVIHVLS